MKVYKFKIPIYFGKFSVIITRNINKAFKKYGAEHSTVDLNQFGAISFKGKKSDTYFVVIRPKVTQSIVVHEANHIVNYLFIDRGIKLDAENDEPQSYLLGWIVACCFKALSSFKA